MNSGSEFERPWEREPAHFFERHGYLPLPALVGASRVAALDAKVRSDLVVGRFQRDATQVAGSKVLYGSPSFDGLLEDLCADLSARVGAQLLPAYSFVRAYATGMELRAHVDRPSCEVSVTLHLGNDQAAPWPLWLHDRQGSTVAVVMRPGAAVAYRGCELSHWREPAPPGSYRQVFLHYVEEGGPYAGLRNDGREALGTASVRGPADHDEQAGHTPPTPGVA